ncbi:MAG TPA: ferritin [Anaerolineaceae bacterium]
MMMISKNLADAINAQVGREFGASFQYVQIAAYFESEALDGLAKLFYKQSDEERDHAMKLAHYVVETGAQLAIPAVEAPKVTFSSAEEAIQAALNWETEVTRQINNLMDIAVAEKDYLAREFLDWFVVEQLEEVTSMEKLLRIAQRAGERNIIMLEAYLSHGGDED